MESANATPRDRTAIVAPAPLVLVLNPTAGHGRGAAALQPLRSVLARRDIPGEFFLTTGEGNAADLVRRLEPPPGSVVIAVGGDGTAHEVGAALLSLEGVTLGLIPAGSGNDYARLLGMPADPAAALTAILDGVDVRLDVGQAGPHVFLNSAGFGFSSLVSLESRRAGRLTGLLRYLVAVARALAHFTPMAMAFDGLAAAGEQRVSLLEVGIGDCCGGGFRLMPKADPCDGLLDVCLFLGLSRTRIPMLLPRALRGHHLGHPRVRYEQVPSFRLTLESDALIHVDGEIRVLQRGEHLIEARPRALRVRLPAQRARALARRTVAEAP
jgi:diacylglycerol kinase (ATP)